jgi:hypothetical protein
MYVAAKVGPQSLAECMQLGLQSMIAASKIMIKNTFLFLILFLGN